MMGPGRGRPARGRSAVGLLLEGPLGAGEAGRFNAAFSCDAVTLEAAVEGS